MVSMSQELLVNSEDGFDESMDGDSYERELSSNEIDLNENESDGQFSDEDSYNEQSDLDRSQFNDSLQDEQNSNVGDTFTQENMTSSINSLIPNDWERDQLSSDNDAEHLQPELN